MAGRTDVARKPREIVVHDWQAQVGIDIGLLAQFLSSTFGIDTAPIHGGAGILRAGAGGPTESCIVTYTTRPFWRQRDDKDARSVPGLHDGHELLRAALAVAGPGAVPGGSLHIMVTDLLVGTYDDADARYHARPVVASNPSLLSTAGAVWGPARSRRYYADIMACRAAGDDENPVEAAHAADHLVAGDARMRTVIEGYAMQAVAYAMTGEAFCAEPECRLADSHWQADVIRLNAAGSLCARHLGLIDGGLT